MKQYIYGPKVFGIEEFPSGTCRLDTDISQQTVIAEEADVFVIPIGFHSVTDEQLYSLPHWHSHHSRHVLLNVSDSFRRAIRDDCLFFRCDTTQWVMNENPWTIPLAWPVEDLGRYQFPEEYEYDVAFHGWARTMACKRAIQSVIDSGLKTNIKWSKEFYGHQSKAVQERRREPFIESLRTARVSLSVASIPEGVIRYRFYEALSMGRVPVHINDNCVYPFEDRINYNWISLRVPEANVDDLGQIITNYLKTNDDGRIASRGAGGRAYWGQYMDSAYWPRIMAVETRRLIREGR